MYYREKKRTVKNSRTPLFRVILKTSVMDKIKEKLNILPDNPGVYVMLDKDGIVIYVGKARILKNN